MTLKKLVLTVFVIFSLISICNAQTTSSASTDVTANLRKGLTITKNVDLAFGDVQMAANNTASSTITPGNGAKFTVSGNNSTLVNVTLSTGTLNLGSAAVTVSSWVMHATDVGTYTAGSNILTGTSGSTTLSSTGSKTLWLGGTLTATTAATPGNKTGTLTVTVAY